MAEWEKTWPEDKKDKKPEGWKWWEWKPDASKKPDPAKTDKDGAEAEKAKAEEQVKAEKAKAEEQAKAETQAALAQQQQEAEAKKAEEAAAAAKKKEEAIKNRPVLALADQDRSPWWTIQSMVSDIWWWVKQVDAIPVAEKPRYEKVIDLFSPLDKVIDSPIASVEKSKPGEWIATAIDKTVSALNPFEWKIFWWGKES